MGVTVVSGMLAATLFGIFLIPALFVFMERITGYKDAPQVRSEEPDNKSPTVSEKAAE